MPIYYNSLLPAVDVIRLVISYLIIYFVQRMEKIKCLDAPSWKPTYMKFFSVVIIILTVVGVLSQPSFEMSSAAVAIGIPLNLVMIYAVYTYIRDLELQFKSCPLSQTDLNIHEFLKFYSLIMVLLVVLALVAVLGIVISFVPFPKYVGIQTQIYNLRTAIIQNSQLETTTISAKSHKLKKSNKTTK